MLEAPLYPQETLPPTPTPTHVTSNTKKTKTEKKSATPKQIDCETGRQALGCSGVLSPSTALRGLQRCPRGPGARLPSQPQGRPAKGSHTHEAPGLPEPPAAPSARGQSPCSAQPGPGILNDREQHAPARPWRGPRVLPGKGGFRASVRVRAPGPSWGLSQPLPAVPAPPAPVWGCSRLSHFRGASGGTFPRPFSLGEVLSSGLSAAQTSP